LIKPLDETGDDSIAISLTVDLRSTVVFGVNWATLVLGLMGIFDVVVVHCMKRSTLLAKGYYLFFDIVSIEINNRKLF